MVDRVRRSSIGAALRRSAEPREWWLDPASASVWHEDDGRWRLYRPQHVDRVWLDGAARHASAITTNDVGQLQCLFGEDVTVCAAWQRLELEPWTASQLNFVGYGDPRQVDGICGDQVRSGLGQAALVPCLARWQQTREYNALIGPATWLGAVAEWAAADIGTVTRSSARGETTHGDAAAQQMVDRSEVDHSRRSNKQLISRFRAQLLEACRSEHSAATSYRAPVGVTAGRYGRRQARSLTGWEWRWGGEGGGGHAQLHRRRVRWFDHPSFDEAKAERTLAW
jgi:hypothetical protein